MNWGVDLFYKLKNYKHMERIDFFSRQQEGEMEGTVEGENHLHIYVKDTFNRRGQLCPLVRDSFILVFVLSNRQLTISNCSCLCRVELSFSCCLLYICMISTTILSLSSSSPPTTTAALLVAEPVSVAATSVTGDNNGAGGGGVWAGLWVAFLQLGLLVSMETAWVWHSRSVAEAASARWDLASTVPAETGGDA